jgi:putative glycosyl hydrolase-like family 15 (GHL15) protein
MAAVVVAVPCLLSGSSPAGATNGTLLKRWAATMDGGATAQALTVDQAVADASSLDLIVARKGTFTPYLADMRAANPSVQLLVYMNGSYAQTNQGPTSGVYPTAWYARDAAGQPVTSKSEGNWLMDVTNPAWVQDRVQTCTSFLAQSGYDGCYVDMLGAASVAAGYVSSRPVNPATKQAWTATDWMAATAKVGAAVKTGNPGRMVVGNGLQNGRQYFANPGATSVLLGGIDGGNAQGWMRGAGDAITAFPSTANWKQEVDMLVDAGAKAKSVIAMTKVWGVTATQDQLDAVHRFSLASFLLGTNGNQYFDWDVNRTDGAVVPDHPYDHVAVGLPSGPYALKSKVYVRYFTNGIAVVNASKTASYTFDLGGTYKSLQGQTMSKVTLAPDTGDVFTR